MNVGYGGPVLRIERMTGVFFCALPFRRPVIGHLRFDRRGLIAAVMAAAPRNRPGFAMAYQGDGKMRADGFLNEPRETSTSHHFVVKKIEVSAPAQMRHNGVSDINRGHTTTIEGGWNSLSAQ